MGDNPLLPQTSSVLNVNYNGYSFECYESLTMFMDKDFNGEDHLLEEISNNYLILSVLRRRTHILDERKVR